MATDYDIVSNRMARQKSPCSFPKTLLAIPWGDDDGRWTLVAWTEDISSQPLQTETLRKLHEGHQGILCCRLRVKMSVWWLGLSHQLTQVVKKMFGLCKRTETKQREPLITRIPLVSYCCGPLSSQRYRVSCSSGLLLLLSGKSTVTFYN